MRQTVQPPTGKTLDQMFHLQGAIMKEYIIRGDDIPEPPLDLATRQSQRLLKNFAWRITEELGEAYDMLKQAYGCISTNHGEEAQGWISMYNEELGDVWHFMLEIMILSDMNANVLMNWVLKKKLTEPELSGILDHQNLYKSFQNLSEYYNQMDRKTHRSRDPNLFVIYPEPDIFEFEQWNMGGRKISYAELENIEQFNWNIIFSLTRAMNCLKNRDWHTSQEKEVNFAAYNDAILDAFIMLMRYMVYIRKSELSVYNTYVIKNAFNYERLKTS